MTVFEFRRVSDAECPACHRTTAVLADDHSGKGCFLCPRCQHVWDATDTVREERARLSDLPEATELGKEHEVPRPIDRDLDPRVAKLVAHVRQTLASLNQEAGERFFKHAPPPEILTKKPFES